MNEAFESLNKFAGGLLEEEGITDELLAMVDLNISYSPVIAYKGGAMRDAVEVTKTIGDRYIVHHPLVMADGSVDIETVRVMRCRYLLARDAEAPSFPNMSIPIKGDADSMGAAVAVAALIMSDNEETKKAATEVLEEAMLPADGVHRLWAKAKIGRIWHYWKQRLNEDGESEFKPMCPNRFTHDTMRVSKEYPKDERRCFDCNEAYLKEQGE